MSLLGRLAALARGDVRVSELEPYRRAGADAYELVEELPRGRARAAAWNAYVLRTYADGLVAASATSRRVRADTAEVAKALYALAGAWVERARDPEASAPLAEPLPHWHTPVRTQDQLAGMRETLDALRVHLAYDLARLEAPAAARERLASIDARLETADGLWIRRAPAELRGGIGDALAAGLDEAYALGRELALLVEAGPRPRLTAN